MTTLHGEDAERLLRDLENGCSPEESKRRQEWAHRELARMGLIPEAKRIAELEAELTSLRSELAAVKATEARLREAMHDDTLSYIDVMDDSIALKNQLSAAQSERDDALAELSQLRAKARALVAALPKCDEYVQWHDSNGWLCSKRCDKLATASSTGSDSCGSWSSYYCEDHNQYYDEEEWAAPAHDLIALIESK